MDIFRYIGGGGIALLGALIILGTYITIFVKRDEKGTSLIPLVGPMAVVGEIALTPLPFSHWLWLAFLVDFNTVSIPAGLVMSLFSSSQSEEE